jgi:hypothetical protein
MFVLAWNILAYINKLLKCHFFLFLFLQNQRKRGQNRCFLKSAGISGGGGRRRKGVGEWIWCKYCVHIYVNGKIRPVETIPGIEAMGGIKENDGRDEFYYDIFVIL